MVSAAKTARARAASRARVGTALHALHAKPCSPCCRPRRWAGPLLLLLLLLGAAAPGAVPHCSSSREGEHCAAALHCSNGRCRIALQQRPAAAGCKALRAALQHRRGGERESGGGGGGGRVRGRERAAAAERERESSTRLASAELQHRDSDGQKPNS